MDKDDAEPRWSIGEVSRRTGITIRTLYHYDEIGLVRPAERTASGHRRYTASDMRRLYRVRALRGFGLSLEELATALARSSDDLVTLRGLFANASEVQPKTVHADTQGLALAWTPLVPLAPGSIRLSGDRWACFGGFCARTAARRGRARGRTPTNADGPGRPNGAPPSPGG